MLGCTGASELVQAQCEPQETLHVFADVGGPDEAFGMSVATDGLIAVVGAPYDPSPLGPDRGAVYLYERQGDYWTLVAILTASDGGGGDLFGSSVAVSGYHIVVGAYKDDTWAGLDAGSAYVFVNQGGVWTEEAKLIPLDPTYLDKFGWAVSIYGDTIVAGSYVHDVDGKNASGAAYVFVRQDGQWVQQAILAPSDGAEVEHFGWSVAVSEDTVVAGAPDAKVNGKPYAGKAYVFSRSGEAWTEATRLTSKIPVSDGAFGISVAVDSDTVVIGTNEGYDGAAYVFGRDGPNWPLKQMLVPDHGFLPDFGWSVAIAGDQMAVGAPGQDGPDGYEYGSMYLFVRNDTKWTQAAEITASDGAAWDQFGTSVAIARNVALAGAPLDATPAGEGAGSAYFYDLNCQPTCYPDFTEDGELNLFDFLDFVNEFNAQGTSADCDQNNVFDLFDFLCFVNAFNLGC